MQKTSLAFAIVTSLLVIIFLIQPIAQMVAVEANPFLFGPHIEIWSPEQYSAKTYQTSTIPIRVQIDTPPEYPKTIKIYYILDLNHSQDYNPQKALSISKAQSFTYLVTGTLDNLSNGTHTLFVYALNAQGKLKGGTSTFLVNITAKSEQPLTTSNLTIALVISTIAIVIGASLAVFAYKKRKKVRDQP